MAGTSEQGVAGSGGVSGCLCCQRALCQCGCALNTLCRFRHEAGTADQEDVAPSTSAHAIWLYKELCHAYTDRTCSWRPFGSFLQTALEEAYQACRSNNSEKGGNPTSAVLLNRYRADFSEMYLSTTVLDQGKRPIQRVMCSPEPRWYYRKGGNEEAMALSSQLCEQLEQEYCLAVRIAVFVKMSGRKLLANLETMKLRDLTENRVYDLVRMAVCLESACAPSNPYSDTRLRHRASFQSELGTLLCVDSAGRASTLFPSRAMQGSAALLDSEWFPHAPQTQCGNRNGSCWGLGGTHLWHRKHCCPWGKSCPVLFGVGGSVHEQRSILHKSLFDHVGDSVPTPHPLASPPQHVLEWRHNQEIAARFRKRWAIVAAKEARLSGDASTIGNLLYGVQLDGSDTEAQEVASWVAPVVESLQENKSLFTVQRVQNSMQYERYLRWRNEWQAAFYTAKAPLAEKVNECILFTAVSSADIFKVLLSGVSDKCCFFRSYSDALATCEQQGRQNVLAVVAYTGLVAPPSEPLRADQRVSPPILEVRDAAIPYGCCEEPGAVSPRVWMYDRCQSCPMYLITKRSADMPELEINVEMSKLEVLQPRSPTPVNLSFSFARTPAAKVHRGRAVFVADEARRQALSSHIAFPAWNFKHPPFVDEIVDVVCFAPEEGEVRKTLTAALCGDLTVLKESITQGHSPMYNGVTVAHLCGPQRFSRDVPLGSQPRRPRSCHSHVRVALPGPSLCLFKVHVGGRARIRYAMSATSDQRTVAHYTAWSGNIDALEYALDLRTMSRAARDAHGADTCALRCVERF